MLGLDGTGRLLDVGCGPGVLTLRLAPLFRETIGLDPDAAMLAAGRQAAEDVGLASIRWVRALAEELPEAAPGPFRLVTFGQSFHWTDELRVAETVYDLLVPGGALALIVHTVAGRPQPSPAGTPIPHAEITAVVEKYLGQTRRAGQGTTPVRDHRFEDILDRTRFGPPCRSSFPVFLISCAAARACCPATFRSPGPRRISSAIDWMRSSQRSAPCSRRPRPTACSGTGPATLRSCSHARAAEQCVSNSVTARRVGRVVVVVGGGWCCRCRGRWGCSGRVSGCR